MLPGAAIAMFLFLAGSLATPARAASDTTSLAAWMATLPPYDPPESGCERYASMRDELRSTGGAVVPLGTGRWAGLWFPSGWEPSKGVVYVIGGHEDCTIAAMTTWMDHARQHGLGVVGVHYSGPDGRGADKADSLYASLEAAVELVDSNGAGTDNPRFLYGFSRGSSKVMGASYYDRKSENPLFNAYIMDSGATNTGDRAPPFVRAANVDEHAWAGAHMWVYCGTGDTSKVPGGAASMCDGLAANIDFITARGGTVDRFYRGSGGHGMFAGHATGKPSDAARELFRYMAAPPPRTPSQSVTAATAEPHPSAASATEPPPAPE